MATLMDQIMGRTDPRDFTLGSRMQSIYGQLRPTLPAARTEVPVDTLGTMTGFMPPAELPSAAPVAARLPQLPTPFQLGMPRGVAMPSAMPVPPPGVMGMAPLGGFAPMAPPPMNITPPAAAAQASGFVPPANVPLPPPRPADMSVRESFMQRLLGNPTQSNAMPVLPSGATLPSQVNWGDAENPADFFRASQALQGLLG